MMKLIGVSPRSKIEGLRAFQAKGWLLVDATYEPVNKLPDPVADEFIRRDYPKLVADLKQLTLGRTVPIILVKKNVREQLESRLVEDGFKVLNRGTMVPFPFPGTNQRAFPVKFNGVLNGAGAAQAGTRSVSLTS